MRKRDKQPPKTKKYFRPTKAGAGMTKAGVAKYRRDNPVFLLYLPLALWDNPIKSFIFNVFVTYAAVAQG